MNQVAQFDQSALNGAIAAFGPAKFYVEGKTAKEKRLSVVNNTKSAEVHAIAVMHKGEIGKAARENIAMQGYSSIASQARRGNYQPLADALALTLAESVVITNRASFETLEDRYEPRLAELDAAGKAWRENSKGDMVPTAKAAPIMAALSMIASVKEGVAAIIASEQKGADE